MTEQNAPKASGKAKAPRTTMIDFIRTWEGSNSVPEVAERLGMTQTSVQARASKYRSPEYAMNDDGTFKLDSNGQKQLVRKAIPLKSMPRGGGAKLDVEDAFTLLAELRGSTVDAIAKASNTLEVKKGERADKRDAKATA